MEKKIRIAVQKSGRLGEETMELLAKAGFDFVHHASSRALMARARNFPLEVLFLRIGDIPQMVLDGLADLGVVGINSLQEKSEEKDFEIIKRLGFGKCRMDIGVPQSSGIETIQDLNGKKIATTYPRIITRYLSERGINAEAVEMAGSVEIAPSIDIADVIFDIVSTGSTFAAHQLVSLETVLHSEAVLITRSGASVDSKLLDDFLTRITSVIDAKSLRSLVMNIPESVAEEIEKCIPGLSSPTLMPLAKKGWIALHAVVKEDDDFWKKIESLKLRGATGILIAPIDRVIF